MATSAMSRLFRAFQTKIRPPHSIDRQRDTQKNTDNPTRTRGSRLLASRPDPGAGVPATMNDTDSRKDPDGYNYDVVRQFTLMTLVWGILGMGLGVFIAAQLVWPALNLDLPWTSFGRIRPIHTSLVIFAFGGSALFATSFYVVQRTSGVRLISDALARFVFWGWQAAIVGMIVSYPLAIPPPRNTPRWNGRWRCGWRSSGWSMPTCSSAPSPVAR